MRPWSLITAQNQTAHVLRLGVDSVGTESSSHRDVARSRAKMTGLSCLQPRGVESNVVRYRSHHTARSPPATANNIPRADSRNPGSANTAPPDAVCTAAPDAPEVLDGPETAEVSVDAALPELPEPPDADPLAAADPAPAELDRPDAAPVLKPVAVLNALITAAATPACPLVVGV